MSYIIKSTTPFASTKLTDKGREKIAKGQLNFSSWSIGDSEINYDREYYVQDGTITGTTKILRPKDRQPNLKYRISNSSGFNTFPFGNDGLRCIKVTVNNEADERGFFNGDLTTGFTTNTTLSGYTNATGVISSSAISGGNSINIGTTSAEIGDFLLLKTGYSGYTNEIPQPHLWFKVQNVVGTTVTVDRELPNFSTGNTTFIVYKGGEIYDNEPDGIAYWDTGTLEFDASCDITVMDVPIWNMNIPYSEDIIGTTGTTEYEKHINYGSYDYLGQLQNYLYDKSNVSTGSLPSSPSSPSSETVSTSLETVSISSTPSTPSTSSGILPTSIGIIHYSNKTISNLYGEFLHVDGASKNVRVHLPNLMYHRRSFSGSTSGNKMGMTFLASGSTPTVNSHGLRWVPLMEDSSLVNGTPLAVGRVFIDLKIITIDDQEILAAMSYKSNRNWTLPSLKLQLSNSQFGVGGGLLKPNETIYMTYSLNNESGSGIAPAAPNLKFSKLKNTTSSQLDVLFNVEDINLFPYMRNDNTTDGFYADTFKVLYQIVANGDELTADGWKEKDFTSSVSGTTFIDVAKLETQSPFALTPNFKLTVANTSGDTIYSIIDILSMPPSVSPELLQFGDERFFYGNIETFIGATIYKTIFKMTINASDFRSTTNITRGSSSSPSEPNVTNLKVSEVGIYDSNGDLVIISKLSDPIELAPGKTVILELSMDF